jgi:predicted RNase H-like HicB family nuclease
MKLAVKITYDFDEGEFVCVVERLQIEGRGQTEQEAIDNFQIQLDKNFGAE